MTTLAVAEGTVLTTKAKSVRSLFSLFVRPLDGSMERNAAV